jgi:ligand-binding SRPBCC domain-containing protein
MPIIRLETLVRAPAAVCFDLARSIDLHVLAPSPLRHRAAAGVTSGLIELGEEVTWAGSFFGVPQRMTSKIVALDAPRAFTDEMQRGPFKRWRHEHRFEETTGGTLMLDRVDFASPLGPFGAAFDALYLKSFMTRVLVAHNKYIKEVAERRLSERSRFLHAAGLS